jgi:hypothetical protein
VKIIHISENMPICPDKTNSVYASRGLSKQSSASISAPQLIKNKIIDINENMPTYGEKLSVPKSVFSL